MSRELLKVFGHNLKSVRLNSHLSVQLFAEKCELSASKIENYLYGRNSPTIPAMINICNAFTVSPNILLNNLFGFPTELDNIRIIWDKLGNLPNDVRMRTLDLCEPIIAGVIDSAPRLEGVNLGARLRVLREDTDLSVSKFSTLCATSESSIMSIESGQRFPGFFLFLAFCNELHVSPEYLLSGNLSFTTFFDKRIALLTPGQIAAFAEAIQKL